MLALRTGKPGALKVAHINLAKTFRGGERQTLLLIRELAERGWRQKLVARRDGELAERLVAELPGVEIVGAGNNPLRSSGALADADIVHAHEARGVYVALAGYWRYRAPYVITRRVLRPQKSSWLRDRAYATAGKVVGVSGAVAGQIRRNYPSIEPVVIPDAHATLEVDAETSDAIRQRYAGKILITHAGSYVHRVKGQLTIIDVARRAAAERPDWHFLLLGAGTDEALFRERIGDLDNIELTGFVDNIGDYLAASDVFVFPSLDEALGSSLLDAMQFGLPIVATRVGGIPEFIKDGINGILIDPQSPRQLFDGIDRLARRSPDVDAMHLANRACAANFSAAHMADAYEDLYRSIL
jgi:glycosyltransferase involved in cell wall biosynthesis